MAISESMALQKIMEIIATPGEDMNDGECIDQIIFILEELDDAKYDTLKEVVKINETQTE